MLPGLAVVTPTIAPGVVVALVVVPVAAASSRLASFFFLGLHGDPVSCPLIPETDSATGLRPSARSPRVHQPYIKPKIQIKMMRPVAVPKMMPQYLA